MQMGTINPVPLNMKSLLFSFDGFRGSEGIAHMHPFSYIILHTNIH